MEVGIALQNICSSVVNVVLLNFCLIQAISLLAMKGQSTPQLRDGEWLNCVLLSPVILKELQKHSPYQPPHEMAQQVMHISSTGVALSLNNTHHPCTVGAGDDYVPVSGENLVFASGDTRVCHTIDIINDDICEHNPYEFFFSDLTYVSGERPITIAPPTAQVVIDDSGELECK